MIAHARASTWADPAGADPLRRGVVLLVAVPFARRGPQARSPLFTSSARRRRRRAHLAVGRIAAPRSSEGWRSSIDRPGRRPAVRSAPSRRSARFSGSTTSSAGRVPAQRVLRAAAVRAGRHGAVRGRRRPDHRVPRDRGSLALALRAHGAHVPPRPDGGRDEVLPAGGVRLGVPAVRDRDGLRRGGHHEHPGLANALSGTTGQPALALVAVVLLVVGLGFKVSLGAVPHVDARRLPGGTEPGDAFMSAATKSRCSWRSSACSTSRSCRSWD